MDVVTKLAIDSMQAALQVRRFNSVISLADGPLGHAGVLDGDRAMAHYRRGVAYFHLGQYDLAAMDFFYAANLYPDNPATKAGLRAAEERLGFEAAKIAPLISIPVEFEDGSTFVWTGDERLVDGPGGWGRDSMEFLELLRMR